MIDIDPALLEDVKSFLPCETPDAWLQVALQHQDILLLNHAYLEKCAARSAITLMFRYPEKADLLDKMSRLAREELVHFEQVIKLLKKRGLKFRPMKASRYVGLLNSAVSMQDPQRLIDLLIIGAFIEARSCERFAKLAPHLDEQLGKFYVSLLQSESRHFQHYLGLAEQYSPQPIADRVAMFREIERSAIESEDPQFRFHSGVPAVGYKT